MRIDIKRGYAAQRKADYPSVEEQLDMIFHEGIDAWMARVKATKERFPKPEYAVPPMQGQTFG